MSIFTHQFNSIQTFQFLEKRLIFEVGSGECINAHVNLNEAKNEEVCDLECKIGSALATVLESVSTSAEANNPLLVDALGLGITFTAEELIALTALLGASTYLSVQAIQGDSPKFQFFKGQKCLNPISLPPAIRNKILASPTLQESVRSFPVHRKNRPIPGFDARKQAPLVVGGVLAESFNKNPSGFQGQEYVNNYPSHILNNTPVKQERVVQMGYIHEKEKVEYSDKEPWVCDETEKRTEKMLRESRGREFKDQNEDTFLFRQEIEESSIAIRYRDGAIFTVKRLPNGKLSLARGVHSTMTLEMPRSFGQNGLNQRQYIYFKKNTKINPQVLKQGYDIWRQQKMRK